MALDSDRLAKRLTEAFDPLPDERRVVCRQAIDLADDGRYHVVRGQPMDVEALVRALAEAPPGFGLVDRWNWWIGAMELAHGGFDRFRVDRWEAG